MEIETGQYKIRDCRLHTGYRTLNENSNNSINWLVWRSLFRGHIPEHLVFRVFFVFWSGNNWLTRKLQESFLTAHLFDFESQRNWITKIGKLFKRRETNTTLLQWKKNWTSNILRKRKGGPVIWTQDIMGDIVFWSYIWQTEIMQWRFNTTLLNNIWWQYETKLAYYL